MDRDSNIGPNNPPKWLPVILLFALVFWGGLLAAVLVWVLS